MHLSSRICPKAIISVWLRSHHPSSPVINDPVSPRSAFLVSVGGLHLVISFFAFFLFSFLVYVDLMVFLGGVDGLDHPSLLARTLRDDAPCGMSLRVGRP